MFPGIGGKSADKLWKCFHEQFHRLQGQAKNPLPEALQACRRVVPKKAVQGRPQLAITFSNWKQCGIGPSQMIRLVIEAATTIT